MSAANLNIITIQRRMLTASEAAQYCGLPVKKFPTICNVSPVELADGIKRYDKYALDKWLDALTFGDATHDDVIARLS